MTVLLFPRKPNHQWNAVFELKRHAQAAINADDETLVCISERNCSESGCAGGRTIVLIMHPTRPAKAVGIDKPLDQITRTDLFNALTPLAAPGSLSEPLRFDSIETRLEASRRS
jgi:hypothetical protein